MRRRRRSWSLGRNRDPQPLGHGTWTSEEFVSVILDDASRWDRFKWRMRYLLKRPPFNAGWDQESAMKSVGGAGRMLHSDLGVSTPFDQAELAGSLTDAQSSPLIRVVAIGQQAEAAGIRIEMIALEVREAGAILYWRAFAPTDEMLGLAVMEVSDEHGRVYNTWLGGGGGGGRTWSGKTNIVPALAPNTRTLRIKVTGFQSFMPGFSAARSHSLEEGPWAFEVPIRD